MTALLHEMPFTQPCLKSVRELWHEEGLDAESPRGWVTAHTRKEGAWDSLADYFLLGLRENDLSKSRYTFLSNRKDGRTASVPVALSIPKY